MRLHHVVFCVRPENQDHAVGLWRELGLTFYEVDLADLGLRVLIDWQAGIEIISPVASEGEQAAAFTEFLAAHGEGFYSIVMAVSEVDGPAAVAARYGATVAYEQHRDHGSVHLDEIRLEPLHGMTVTFLATDALP
jgi:methylmalonyl-CoA/ethylmalonyl-CoA epimerase